MVVTNRTKSESGGPMSVLFLSSGPSQHNDNYVRIPDAFSAGGWRVTVKSHESLSYLNGYICAEASDAHLVDYDLIWPIGFGNVATFLDRVGLLQLIPQTKLVTSMNAWLTAHGKSAFLDRAPPSAVASCAQTLLEFMDCEGGDWVLKPNAGSFGRDVHFVPQGKQGRDTLAAVMERANGEFFMLQRFVPAIKDGETRTLIADGQILGSYLRTPTRDIRANVALDAHVERTDLSATAQGLVEDLSAHLFRANVGFAAIDTVGEHLIEVNIANPGGLATLTELYEHDFAADLVAVIAARDFDR